MRNLRCTHANWLVDKGVPIVVLKAGLMQSKTKTTLKYYNHVTDEMRENLLDTLNS